MIVLAHLTISLADGRSDEWVDGLRHPMAKSRKTFRVFGNNLLIVTLCLELGVVGHAHRCNIHIHIILRRWVNCFNILVHV